MVIQLRVTKKKRTNGKAKIVLRRKKKRRRLRIRDIFGVSPRAQIVGGAATLRAIVDPRTTPVLATGLGALFGRPISGFLAGTGFATGALVAQKSPRARKALRVALSPLEIPRKATAIARLIEKPRSTLERVTGAVIPIAKAAAIPAALGAAALAITGLVLKARGKAADLAAQGLPEGLALPSGFGEDAPSRTLATTGAPMAAIPEEVAAKPQPKQRPIKITVKPVFNNILQIQNVGR